MLKQERIMLKPGAAENALPAFLLFGLFGLLCKVFAQLLDKGQKRRKSFVRHTGNGTDQLAFCIVVVLQPRKYFRKLLFTRFFGKHLTVAGAQPNLVYTKYPAYIGDRAITYPGFAGANQTY